MDFQVANISFSTNGISKRVIAKKNMILSSGVFKTSHILLHSGIGDKDKCYNLSLELRLYLGKDLRVREGIYSVRVVNDGLSLTLFSFSFSLFILFQVSISISYYEHRQRKQDVMSQFQSHDHMMQ